jgi:Family of unknown function (DUF5681)
VHLREHRFNASRRFGRKHWREDFALPDIARQGGPPAHIRRPKQLEMTMTSDDAPPDGGNATRPMRQALSEELHRAITDDNGQTAQALRLIVRKLTAKAIDGDIQAIKEIFDRMDGKSAAGATTDEGPRKVTLQ